MPIVVTHGEHLRDDDTDATLVRPSAWREAHVLSQAGERLIGRSGSGSGAAEEISVTPGTALASDVLTLSPKMGLLAVDIFTSSDTWTKHANALLVDVVVIGGGASGAALCGRPGA